MNKLQQWAKNHPALAAAALLIVLSLALFATQMVSLAVRDAITRSQDSKIQKQIDADAGAATTHENNANSAGEQRQAAEGRAELAEQQKQQAAANSNRSFDSVRKARQRDQETSRSSPADSPDLSDEQLCAELTKRGIPCK